MIKYIIQILQINMFGLEKVLTPLNSKRYGYPPFTFDVGVGSHLTWGYWCLDGGCDPSL